MNLKRLIYPGIFLFVFLSTLSPANCLGGKIEINQNFLNEIWLETIKATNDAFPGSKIDPLTPPPNLKFTAVCPDFGYPVPAYYDHPTKTIIFCYKNLEERLENADADNVYLFYNHRHALAIFYGEWAHECFHRALYLNRWPYFNHSIMKDPRYLPRVTDFISNRLGLPVNNPAKDYAIKMLNLLTEREDKNINNK